MLAAAEPIQLIFVKTAFKEEAPSGAAYRLLDFEQQPSSYNGVYPITEMRTIRIIVGIVCWAFALFFLLGVAAAFADNEFTPVAIILFAVPSFFFAIAGWLLISKRKRPISNIGKVTITAAMALLFGFIIVIAIPEFVRMRYSSSQNACMNTLRELQAAKQEWALEKEEPNNAVATVADITPYIQLDSNGNIPKCPAGGTYILGRVSEDVKCSIGTSDWPSRHVLSDTNNFTWEDNFKGAYSILFGLRHVRKP